MDTNNGKNAPAKPRIREAIVVEGRYDKNTLAQVVDAVIIETRGFGVFTDDELLALLRRLADTCGVIVLTDSDGAGFQIRNRVKSALGGAVKHAYIPEIEGKERRKRIGSRAGTLGVEGMRPETLLRALRDAGATFENSESSPPNAAATSATVESSPPDGAATLSSAETPPSDSDASVAATPHSNSAAPLATAESSPSDGNTSEVPPQRSTAAPLASAPPRPRTEQLTKYDLYALGLSGTPEASQRRAALLQRLQLPHLLSANALLDVLNALYARDELLSILSSL